MCVKLKNYIEQSWEEFQEAIKEDNSLILIPIGCLEEHGPHLPINTDGFIATKICEIVAEKNDIILGPEVLFGTSRTTQGFPGTIEIRIETLRSLIYDIVYSFANQGVQKIVLFTWHGGTTHSTILREASIDVLEKIREERGLPKDMNIDQFESLPHIYLLSGVRLLDGKLEKEVLEILETIPYHAAELETSIMLHLFPNMVKNELLTDLKEEPKFPEGRIFARGNPWLKKGLMGDASKSSAEKGKRICDIFIDALSERIQDYIK